jgi:hypothetical protein
MNRFALPLCLLLGAVGTGCATAPSVAALPAASRGLDCSQLEAQIAHAEDARRAALEKEQNAWKVIVPFAVAARYASGKTAVAEAEQRLAQWRAESIRLGCDSHGT